LTEKADGAGAEFGQEGLGKAYPLFR